MLDAFRDRFQENIKAGLSPTEALDLVAQAAELARRVGREACGAERTSLSPQVEAAPGTRFGQEDESGGAATPRAGAIGDRLPREICETFLTERRPRWPTRCAREDPRDPGPRARRRPTPGSRCWAGVARGEVVSPVSGRRGLGAVVLAHRCYAHCVANAVDIPIGRRMF